MDDVKKIFTRNHGSTSTKVTCFKDDTCVFRDTICHDEEEFTGCLMVFDQKDLREKAMLGLSR